MKIVFFGTPAFAVPSLEQLIASRHEVCLVVSRPDKQGGRGKRQLLVPPVIELAQEHGLPCRQPKQVKGQELFDLLQDSQAAAAVVVAFGRLIPEELLELPRFGFINLHPSLLPRHRGPSPIQWTLVCGDRFAGITTMQLDSGMDTGPILLQRRVAIEPQEDAEQLSSRLAELGAELVVETLDQLQDGALEPRPQPTDGVNVTPMLRREMAEVDWGMSALKLRNRLRGFTPWPGLFTTFRGGRLKIFGLEEVSPPPAGAEAPGTVLAAEPAGLVVRCGNRSAARLTELQREGRRRMPADAFLIGEPVSRGEQLG